MTKKIITVVGARPQFVKAAVLSRIFKDLPNIEEKIIHTGQHFDAGMSDIFFQEMEIPQPHFRLDINGVGHGAMTGRMLEKIEEVLIAEKPDLVLVYGDTNSTLAGAIAAKKLNIKVAHVEAGLRSFNMKMPEEINRVVSDHLSDILFAPTNTALENLKKEGLEDKTLLVGDIFIESFNYIVNKINKSNYLVRKPYLFTTIHRAENTDKKEWLIKVDEYLSAISWDASWARMDELMQVEIEKNKFLLTNKIEKHVRLFNSGSRTGRFGASRAISIKSQ